jgi:hypothetical protein
MKNREYHVGPGAVSLLLIIVVVSMSVLGLLSLISARGEYKLTERAAQLAGIEHATSAQAEYRLAQLDALLASCEKTCSDDESYIAAVEKALPEGMEMDGRVVSWVEQGEGGRALYCAVQVHAYGSQARCSWAEHSFLPAQNEGYDEMNFDIWE